jgi:hypothetical protein
VGYINQPPALYGLYRAYTMAGEELPGEHSLRMNAALACVEWAERGRLHWSCDGDAALAIRPKGAPTAMTIVHAYTLLLEAVALAASFALLWLSFWVRDRRRSTRSSGHPPLSGLASEQQNGAGVGSLVLSSVASAAG